MELGYLVVGNLKMWSFLILRVLLRPLFFWLVALALFFYLRVSLIGSLSESTYLVGLSQALGTKLVWIAVVPFAIGVLSFIQRLQLLYWWHSGASQGCDNCGGPQDEKTGRFGPYRKCFLCGRTKKDLQ